MKTGATTFFQVMFLLLFNKVSKEKKWVSFTLRETHYENDVDGDETQQVSHNHAVNHDDERTYFLEPSFVSTYIYVLIN